MGRLKKKVTKKKKTVEDNQIENVGTVETEHHLEQQPLKETEHESAGLNEEDPADLIDAEQQSQPTNMIEEADNEVAEEGINDNLGEDTESDMVATEKEQETLQPQRKKQRGPTKMKNIAKDPNTREKVDFTDMGEPYGPGSVKLSSYVGPLVREHVPVTIDDWRKVSEEIRTILWKSVQARFELDEVYQKTAVIKQMGCLWRSSKSRLVTQIRNAPTNQARMNLRPKNVPINDWRKFIKMKTSNDFKVVSDKYRERRRNQIPHTYSRRGMVRLTEDMKKECPEPSKVTRLKVWVKSRTKKDGNPVNTNAAEKIRKAAEMETATKPEKIVSDAPSSTNPKEDGLSQILGPDNPGRLRAMGRGMSMTKLAIFQVKSKCMAQMQENQVSLQRKVYDLEAVIANLKRGETEVGENSSPRTVNKRAHPKCVLVDWCGTDDSVAEGRLLSSDPQDFVNDIPLGPSSVKVLVETAKKPDAFLWRPAPNMFSIEQAVGEMIAWPAKNCVLTDVLSDPQDIPHTSPSTTCINMCKLMDWSGNDEVVVAEGRWQSQEPKALVNGLPLGPNVVKVFVDVVFQPETFLWRPSAEITTIEDCLKSFIAWHASSVVFETTTYATPQSQLETPQMQTPPAPVKKPKIVSESPVRKSPGKKQDQVVKGKKQDQVVKENQKCKLMYITGKKRVVAEGRWSSNNLDQVVHFVPLGPNAVRVWVDIVKVKDDEIWRPSSEIECMEDAIGTTIAWPEDKVVVF